MKSKGVYKIVNTINGRFYIGSTTRNFEARWSLHKSNLNKGKHSNSLLQGEWFAFGEKAFVFKPLSSLSDADEILKEEQRLLQLYFDQGDRCYNLTHYASPGSRRTYEQQTKIREGIQKYLEENDNGSLREIANYVKEKTGIRPSPPTVSRLLKGMGYTQRLIWKKGRAP